VSEPLHPADPRVLVSLFADDEQLLRLHLANLRGIAGRIELRLDSLAPDLDLATLPADFPEFRFYAACRILPKEESRTDRLLRAAAAGFAGVDFPVEDGAVPEVPQGVRRILSWHQDEAGEVDLRQVLSQMQGLAQADDLLKIVSWADYAEQAWPVLGLYDQVPSGSLLAFAQGPGGSASRFLALHKGAPWIYSSWPGQGTAPGQWHVGQVGEMLPSAEDMEAPSLGVVGDPVAHSLSPFLWRRASLGLEQSRPELLYLPYRVADLELFLEGAARFKVEALSVTAPHKQAAYAMASRQGGLLPGGLGVAADACRAANLIRLSEEGWSCGNSDGIGAMDALEAAGMEVGGAVLILGAGGAARAVMVEALDRGSEVTVATRRDVVDLPGGVQRSSLEAVDPMGFDAVIQATPVGSMSVPGMLCEGRPPRPGAFALDMVYHPPRTAWLMQAEEAGAIPVPGTRMLLFQMLAQYESVRYGNRPALRADDLGNALQSKLLERDAVVLVGARASGKSTLGRALAEQLQWDFHDADDILVENSGRSIAEWLEQDPEGFRDLEARILQDLCSCPNAIIATGGGVVERPSSVALLRSHSRSVWLQCSADELLKRQTAAPRPALSDEPLAEEIRLMLERREPDYRQVADLVISTNETLSSAVDKVIRHFRLRGILHGFR
jgi:shikimate kinase